jgi:hypothetical protein
MAPTRSGGTKRQAISSVFKAKKGVVKNTKKPIFISRFVGFKILR